jgi:hypothetical protein
LLKAASGAASVEDATAQIERALFMELTLLLSGQNARSVWKAVPRLAVGGRRIGSISGSTFGCSQIPSQQ